MEIKRKEQLKLYETFKTNPELFAESSRIEDAAFLRDFGIVIPGKESCPQGYLKLYPSDFIVEEVGPDGTVSTIDAPVTPEAVPVQVPGAEKQRIIFATLVKCNISTFDAIEDMAKRIGCSPQDIHYAGLKDKNAITSQAISFHGVDSSKLATISSPHYFLKDMRYGKGGVSKGGLKGNRFTLFIRTQGMVDQEAFMAQERRVAETGFYNFYYLQRFGVPRFMSHELGFDIARGRYKETIIKYLTVASEREVPYFNRLRINIAAVVPDWTAVKALIEPFPLIMANENKIVDHLISKPEDYLGALLAVQEQATLWVYAFSSLLFNESISTYIQIGEPVPPELPLLLSTKKEDVDFYARLLTSIKYYPPQFQHLRPFRTIILQERRVRALEKAAIDSVAFSPEGVSFRFSLNKGEYATTFLSHLFNMVSGRPPEGIAEGVVDTPSLLSKDPISRTIEYFAEVNTSRKDSGFGQFENM